MDKTESAKAAVVVRFGVAGEAIGKQRPKFTTFGGYAKAYTPKKTAGFENLIKIEFEDKISEEDRKKLMECSYYWVSVEISHQMPKSVSKKKRGLMCTGVIQCTTKPDVDNVAKSVLDALNGIAYRDDSMITKLTVLKWYSDIPKTVVEIVGYE